MFENSKWIWCDSPFTAGQVVDFFFSATLDTVPEKALLSIGCETKYLLFVNGALAVFDGGLFRESLPGCGYFDSADIARYLKNGRNDISLRVIYYGNGGRNNSFCPSAGLILECPELGLFSDASTLCYENTAYYIPKSEPTSHLYGGDHTAYDARLEPFCFYHDGKNSSTARVVGGYGDEPFGLLVERPIPLLRFSDRISCDYCREADKVTVRLPYAMHFTPYFKLEARSGDIIDIRSDRFEVHGGPGDTANIYRGHRAEYICRDGEQEFEMLDWIFGEKLIFTVPSGVKVIELGYRESGYDTTVVTEFECDDPLLNRLFEKSVRTLLVCMRENLMDCPDRERGQWIGDVSVQAPQIAYLLDGNGMLLLKKAIFDFIRLRKGDVLVGNVPGDNYSELPSQSLNAISEVGMISTYYQATGDSSVLKLAFRPAIRYLALWELDNDGVPLPRKGNWEWYDHLYNCDGEILNICWYYSALRFAKFMAEELGDISENGFISARMSAIESVFEKRYWNKGMKCYASGAFADDRANAMAVLSGLCPKEHYPDVRYLLLSVFNSTAYMENYVLSAICEMGYKSDALTRMKNRYYSLAVNENSTLWEDFYHLGTKNHAWSGAPATVLIKYFAGITPSLTVNETDIYPLKYLKCSFRDKNIERVCH